VIIMSTRSLLPAIFIFLLFAVGCSSPAPTTGTVVVGLTSQLRAGVDVDRMHVVLRAGGDVIGDRVLSSKSGSLTFPAEFPFEDLEAGTPVRIDIEVFRAGDTTKPLLVRAASTEVIAGRSLLLPVRLESKCVTPPDGSACPSEQTCIAGACSDAGVAPGRLDTYTPAWKDSEPDVCKPAGGGEPIVIVGEGQGDYLPLDELDEAQVEAGPQGGHHIWVAIRVKNLRQSGSVTSVSGTVPELQYALSPYTVIFTFDADEGGFCKLAGLRFQLDQTIDIHELLGKIVDVEATVKDRDGVTGIGKRRVTLSQAIR
jgi:hypothetical protein